MGLPEDVMYPLSLLEETLFQSYNPKCSRNTFSKLIPQLGLPQSSHILPELWFLILPVCLLFHSPQAHMTRYPQEGDFVLSKLFGNSFRLDIWSAAQMLHARLTGGVETESVAVHWYSSVRVTPRREPVTTRNCQQSLSFWSNVGVEDCNYCLGLLRWWWKAWRQSLWLYTGSVVHTLRMGPVMRRNSPRESLKEMILTGDFTHTLSEIQIFCFNHLWFSQS